MKRVSFCSAFKALSTDTSFIKIGVCQQKLSTLEFNFYYRFSSHCLNYKYSNSATQLLGDSVAQLVRAWQAICQVVGLSRALSHCHFFLGTRQLSTYRILSTCAVVLC